MKRGAPHAATNRGSSSPALIPIARPHRQLESPAQANPCPPLKLRRLPRPPEGPRSAAMQHAAALALLALCLSAGPAAASTPAPLTLWGTGSYLTGGSSDKVSPDRRPPSRGAQPRRPRRRRRRLPLTASPPPLPSTPRPCRRWLPWRSCLRVSRALRATAPARLRVCWTAPRWRSSAPRRWWWLRRRRPPRPRRCRRSWRRWREERPPRCACPTPRTRCAAWGWLARACCAGPARALACFALA